MRLVAFVAEVAGKQGGNKKEAQKSVQAVFDSISHHVGQGDTLRIPGFGTFYRRVSKARKISLPGGGTKDLPETWSVRFRPASALKGKV